MASETRLNSNQKALHKTYKAAADSICIENTSVTIMEEGKENKYYHNVEVELGIGRTNQASYITLTYESGAKEIYPTGDSKFEYKDFSDYQCKLVKLYIIPLRSKTKISINIKSR